MSFASTLGRSLSVSPAVEAPVIRKTTSRPPTVMSVSAASARSVPNGVEVELLPNGRIALDFGHYEES